MKTMRFILLLLLFLIEATELNATNSNIYSLGTDCRIKLVDSTDVLPFDTLPQMHNDKYFIAAFDELSAMLSGNQSYDLKRAVFLVESAFLSGNLNYSTYCKEIDNTVNKINQYIDINNIRHYKTAVNAALFDYFTKPNWMNGNRPFAYDIEDSGGEQDISQLFVSKLMRTHSGQCQSLPLYYKILCNELGGKASIAYAPNHMYIKHTDEEGKWRNIELTTGSFARDEWYIEVMNISTEAIRNGIFLSATGEEDDIAYMLIMLAETYRFKYRDYDTFTLACAEKVLSVLPDNCNGLYLKMQTLAQWKYDYIHLIGKKYSHYIEYVANEFYWTKLRLGELGFSTISTNQYIENIDKAYKQLEIDTPQNWKKFKEQNNK